MFLKKLLLLLLKALGAYLLVFVLWLFLAPYYLQLLGFSSAKLLPLVLKGEYRLESYQVVERSQSAGSQRTLLRYYVQVSPQVRNWIEFGTNDLTYPLVTFFTLVLVTPQLAWKRRVLILAAGFIFLWLLYSLMALFFFRVIDFVDGRGLSRLGIIEDLFGIQRLAGWKQSGGLTILAGQVLPVAVWFVSVFGQFRKGIKDKSHP